MCALGLCLHKPFPPSGRHPPHLTPPVSVLPPWHSCRKSSMIHWLTVASFPLSSPPSLLLGSSKGAGHIHPHVSWSLTGQLISACLLHPQPLPRALRRIRTQYWGQHLTSSLSDFSPCVPSTQRPSFIHSFTYPFAKHRAPLCSKLVPGAGHTVVSQETQPSISELTVC